MVFDDTHDEDVEAASKLGFMVNYGEAKGEVLKDIVSD